MKSKELDALNYWNSLDPSTLRSKIDIYQDAVTTWEQIYTQKPVEVSYKLNGNNYREIINNNDRWRERYLFGNPDYQVKINNVAVIALDECNEKENIQVINGRLIIIIN